MINVINEQVNLVLEDLELISDPYQRGMVRTNLINALGNLVIDSVEAPKGKDAIKNDIPKENEADAPIKFEAKEEVQEVVEEKVEEKKEEKPKKSTKKTTKKSKEKEEVKEPAPKEVDVDPNTKANEPIMYTFLDDDNQEQQIDVTEAYNLIKTEMPEEDKLELAATITDAAVGPIYATLTNISDGMLKATLAYQMQQVSLEDINSFIYDLSEQEYDDVYDFVNDNNIEYVTSAIEEAMEDGEEE